MKTRVLDLALLALAIVVVLFAAYVVRRDPQPPTGGGAAVAAEPTVDASDEPVDPTATSPTTSPTEDPTEGPGSAGPDLVLVLGDDSAREAGTAGRWTKALGEALDADVDNRARRGSGFVTDGSADVCDFASCPSMTTMLSLVARQGVDPDLVVVSGGAIEGLDQPKRAVGTFFKAAREQFPDATIIATGPFWLDGEPPAGLEELQTDVAREVREVGGTYLDLGQPFLGDEPKAPFAGRVDVAGEQIVAAIVAEVDAS